MFVNIVRIAILSQYFGVISGNINIAADVIMEAMSIEMFGRFVMNSANFLDTFRSEIVMMVLILPDMIDGSSTILRVSEIDHWMITCFM